MGAGEEPSFLIGAGLCPFNFYAYVPEYMELKGKVTVVTIAIRTVAQA